MRIKPVKTEADYEAALGEIERLMDARPGTPNGDRLDVLATLVEDYERKRWPIDPPDPVTSVRFCIEDRGVPQERVIRIFGQRSHFYEFMNGTRGLPMRVAYLLHERLGIPAESLLQPMRGGKISPSSTPAKRRRRAA